MKKIIPSIVLAALCPFLKVSGQVTNNNTTAGTKSNGTEINHSGKTTLQPLKIGDVMPDVTITNIANYHSKSAKISDFKGKLLILDFWATWCSPCVAMIPKMDSLQKVFKGKVQFLPISNQPSNVVSGFLKKLNKLKAFDLPDVLEDSLLNHFFPHSYLPHYVWINPSGKIIAITEYIDVNETNITKILAGQTPNLKIKQDELLSTDASKGLFSPSDSNIKIIHKLITSYQDNLPSQYQIFPEDGSGKRILATNLIMPDLFNLALGEGITYYGNNRIIYEVKDTSKLTRNVSGQEAVEWMKEGHVYSYEVKVPPGMGKLAFQIMANDLNNYFKQYNVDIEKREVKCLALIRTTSSDNLHTKGGQPQSLFDGISCRLINFPLQRLVAELSVQYMSNSPCPIIDNTGYHDRVDLEINAKLSDVKAVNSELSKYGLRLQEMDLPLDVMVIRDRNPTN